MRVETDLAAKREELQKLQDELRRERIRLTQLRAKLAESRAVLSDRLVALYKADKPDVVSVILESDGFADLLERAEFMERVSDQDGRIINDVRDAKADVGRGRAEARPPRGAPERGHRDRREAAPPRSATIKDGLVTRQDGPEAVRSDKRQSLVSVRSDRHELETTSPRSRRSRPRSPRGSPASTCSPPAPVKQGSGRFIWPVNGTFTSPFGYRWGRLHAGIDIAVPEGTPLRAADGGTVAIAGLDRRLRQLHLHQPRRRRLHVLRPPVADRGLGRPERRARARSSATPATRATRPARTCTSRSGSAAIRSTPMGYL